MKTLLLLFIMVTSASGLSVYAQSTNKALVVYYSRTGNTETVAKHIQKLTSADIVKIETVKEYSKDYKTTTEVAKEEKNKQARPAIENKVENINEYNTIFIGFPIWWGTYPMAIATFIENHNLQGKTIIPFCTHGGGGVDQGFTDVTKLLPDATNKKGLSLSGSRASSSLNDIEKWLRQIEAIK